MCLLKLTIPVMCTLSSHGSSKDPVVLCQADNQYEAWCLALAITHESEYPHGQSIHVGDEW